MLAAVHMLLYQPLWWGGLVVWTFALSRNKEKQKEGLRAKKGTLRRLHQNSGKWNALQSTSSRREMMENQRNKNDAIGTFCFVGVAGGGGLARCLLLSISFFLASFGGTFFVLSALPYERRSVTRTFVNSFVSYQNRDQIGHISDQGQTQRIGCKGTGTYTFSFLGKMTEADLGRSALVSSTLFCFFFVSTGDLSNATLTC